MAIIATRIDGRLIHGQVANLWTTKLNISRIMVIDGAVAQSDIEKQGLKLACPPGENFLFYRLIKLQIILKKENMILNACSL